MPVNWDPPRRAQADTILMYCNRVIRIIMKQEIIYLGQKLNMAM